MSQVPNAPPALPSIDRARLWAQASSTIRGPEQPVNEFDLFLGTLLAGPEAHGEMRTLIGYFGLTARDLLPDYFPIVTVENLRRAAATIDPASTPRQEANVLEIIGAVRQRPDRAPALADLIGELLMRATPFQQSLGRALERFGVSVTELAGACQSFFLNLDAQANAGEELGKMLAQRFPLKPASLPAFSSDAVDPKVDFIGLRPGADAFAYLISSRALVPPLAIGLFGRWGSGKSFLMAKIRFRIMQLSDLAATKGGSNLHILSRIAHNGLLEQTRRDLVTATTEATAAHEKGPGWNRNMIP
ncbi:P-loop NTPase fold protein [Kribbella sp. NBC_00359]|uniref:P-loop NTPase fold protein n=1 Tax=Kribbella sp. NBC_00359 TaxID=2975966 RepID=UPI002E1CE011